MCEKYFNGTDSHQYQSMDHIFDLLLESNDLTHFLNLGLEWIVSCINRPGGALYMISPDTELVPGWCKYNIPEIWESQINDPESLLIKEVLQVYLTNTPGKPNPILQVSAFLPMSAQGKTVGVAIIHGEPLTPEELSFANNLIFIFSRLFMAQTHALSLWVEKKEKGFLKIMDSFVKEMITDPNQALLNVVQGIRGYFNADYLLFLQKDIETPELITKKLLSDRDDWIYQISQRISPEYLLQLLDTQNTELVQTLPTDSEIFNDLIGIIKPKINSSLYYPIFSEDKELLGCIILINTAYQIGPFGREFIRNASTLLVDAIENINSLKNIKINLAKLEVRQMELLNSRNNLRTMFDNIPTSIYIVDSSYKILIINFIRSTRLSNTPHDLVGKTCYEALYNRTSPCTACRINETLTEGKSTSRIWREWTSSETFVEWEINTHPIFDEMHIPFQAIVLEVDITEKRNLEANLIQSEKLAAVGQLAAGVAHEINNPLAAIIANAQILLQEVPKENEDEIESLKLIETAGIRASQVVRNLLSISRKESLEFESTDINVSIRNALVLIQHELLKRPITVKLELSEDMPHIHAQQDHLQGVWINLFLNAIDAISTTNRPDGLLQIKTWFNDSLFHIDISDNGKGIEPEKLKRIFEPFYTTKAVGHGTGLGLSVCLRVIKEHQGTITAESQPGQGTHFSITLPLTVENVPD